MLDRKSAPQHAEIRDFQLPTPEIIPLSNGAQLVLFGDVKQEILKLEVVFKAGKWFEPRPGVSHFTAQMLERGTSSRSSYQIAEAFDQFGCSIEINAGFDFTSLSLYTLSRNISRVLPLFCELISTPSFPELELTLMKNVFRQNLKINNKKNSYLAGKAIRKNIFSSLHPYGNSIEELDVDNLTREDLVLFFNTHFSLHQIYITGSLPGSARQAILHDLGHLKAGYPAMDKIEFPTNRKSFSQIIEMPDSVQSSLRLGKRTINRAHADYPTFVLLNHILGGYFGSRLMKNIREEKGLTYGIHSSINALKNDALFIISTDVNKENQKLAISEIKAEIIKLQENLVGLNELEITKNHLLGSIQLETANPFSIAEKIKTIRLNQLKPDFYSTLYNNIMSSNSEMIQHVAKSYLDVESLFEASVG
ncbi:MAG: insulinase family protein [Cyclobacteriaceae bacterium]|nr:insulinase family protein [Cyclobacteriaceae bacterium]